MKKSLLFLTIAGFAFSAVADATVAPGEYFLRHVATGQYVTSGIPWGTAAVLGDTGRRVTVSASQTEGNVTLKSTIGDGYFKFEDEIYMDGNADFNRDYVIKPAEKGVFITSESDGKTKAFGVNQEGKLGAQELNEADESQLWEFVTEADLLAGLSAATLDSPVDVTFAIRGHDVGVYDKDNEYWVVDKPAGSKINTNIWGPDGWDTKDFSFALICDESAETAAATQEVSGLPSGYYTVGCQISCWNATPDCTVNDVPLDVKMWDQEGDLWHNAFTDECKNGGYDTEKYVQVGVDGKLNIRLAMDAKGDVKNRIVFDNFKLAYLGTDAPEGYGIKCVKEIAADDMVTVYSVNGMTVRKGVINSDATTQLPAGLYIISNGSATRKVAVSK